MAQSIICPDARTAREILETRLSPFEWVDAAITFLAGEDGIRCREVAEREYGSRWVAERPEEAVYRAARQRHACEKVTNRAFTASEAVRWERAFVDGWRKVRNNQNV